MVLPVLALLAGLLTTLPTPAAAAETQRLAGVDRFATAAEISSSHFSPGVPAVFLATGLSFPDALAAGPAATRSNAPVLLLTRDRIPPATRSELERLTPRSLKVLGGPSVVSDAVLAELAGLTSGEVTRIAGTNRYETAAKISQSAFSPGVENLFLATGLGFPDALAAGPAAGRQAAPVLLTDPGLLPPATRAEIQRLAPKRITVLGGPGVIWPSIEAELAGIAPTSRLFGPDRFATSAAVARAAFPTRTPAVFLATGRSFPDALVAAPVAAAAPGPLMLVQPDCIPPSVAAEIDRLAPDRIVILGDAAVVSDRVAAGTRCASGFVEPVTSGGPARTFIPEAPDYASESFGDPWDYANSEDIHVGTPQMSNAGSISGGLLSYTTATQYPWMDPIPYLPGSYPLERDGPSAPVDTTRYTHVSFRMYASAAGYGNVVWSTCDWSVSRSCSGATGIATKPGWHTYDIRLTPTDRNFTAPWSGRALQLRVTPHHQEGVQIRLDWMRLHGAQAPVRFDLALASSGATNEVFWDADASLANNTPDAPGWGLLGSTSQASFELPVAALPPGSYRLYTRASGRTGPYTRALHILSRPRAIVDSPSLATGVDYATSVRKNPWDFSGLDDVGKRANVCNARITGGVLAANNCGGEIDNPFFFLPNPTPIEGNRFHRLTFRMRYDGPFGLTGGPTGGAVARLIWYVQSDLARSDQNVHDIVIYPGWQTISVDLKTNPPAAITDETQKATRIGWANQIITSLRFDPNEDVSERRWYVDSVRLTAEDRARGLFTVRFRDTSGLGGRGEIFLDTDRAGGGGTLAARLPHLQPQNAVAVGLPAALPAGRYWPYVEITGPAGTSRVYARAPVHLSR